MAEPGLDPRHRPPADLDTAGLGARAGATENQRGHGGWIDLAIVGVRSFTQLPIDRVAPILSWREVAKQA